ncbi:MAG: hypothetical protein ACK5OX_07685 [Desertimonas sp.]
MSGFGDQPVHGSYDEIANELRGSVKRLTLPLAAAVRKRARAAKQAAEATRREARQGEAELLRRQTHNRTAGAQRGR